VSGVRFRARLISRGRIWLYRLSVRSPQPRCLSGAARYFLRRGLGALRVGGHPSLAFSTTSSSPLLAIDINRCQSTEDSDDDAGPNHTQVYLPEQVWVSLAEERYHSQTVRNHECPTSTRECRVGPSTGKSHDQLFGSAQARARPVGRSGFLDQSL
jgi:hypothetical protein